PSPVTPRAPRKKARVAEMVATIGLRQAQRPVEVLCVDESHFTNEPYVQRGWCRKGHQSKVPTPTRRQSATLFGALPLRTQCFYWKRAPRGSAPHAARPSFFWSSCTSSINGFLRPCSS